MTKADEAKRGVAIMDMGGIDERRAPCVACGIPVVIEMFRMADFSNGDPQYGVRFLHPHPGCDLSRNASAFGESMFRKISGKAPS